MSKAEERLDALEDDPERWGEMRLKKCPFCGAKAERGETDDGAIFVECTGCRASSALVYPLKDGAEEHLRFLWNRRAMEGE